MSEFFSSDNFLAAEIALWREKTLTEYRDLLVQTLERNTVISPIDFLMSVQGLRNLGIADKDLYEEIGVADVTFKRWLNKKGKVRPINRKSTIAACIAIVNRILRYEDSRYKEAAPKI